MRVLYSAVWYLATPVLVVWMLVLIARDRAWRGGLRERFGLVRWSIRKGIWIHAASVGEVQAALPLVDALRMQYPELPLTLTAFTPTGRAHALRNLPHDVDCMLLPFDFPGAAARFIRRLRPRVAVIIETELWPNLFGACERARVPVLMVSARLTEQGARSYRRWRRLTRATLRIPAIISAQTDADAGRIQALGADPTRVTVGGNIKFDFRLPAGIADRAAGLRDETGIGDKAVWIAASTHEGEEEAVLAAHDAVLAARRGVVLVLAPRHPDRADAVAEAARAAGRRVARRSAGETCKRGTHVYLLDTLGELATFYGLAEVAFIGGTLVPVGGHNLLEPAAFGLPLLCGPHVEHVSDMFALLHEAGAVERVEDAAQLGATVLAMLDDAGRRGRAGEAARRVLEQNRGAVDRAVHLIDGVLEHR